MRTNARPVSGFGQPANGLRLSLAYLPMKTGPKKRKVPGFMREVLAQNISKLMQHHYRDTPNKPLRLAKEAGVSLSTVQRLINKETGASLDNIEAIASAFQLSSYQLMLPALDPKNPQVVRGATKDEERLYRLWKQTITASGT